MSHKTLSDRIANLSPEKREALLKQLKKQKTESGRASRNQSIGVIPRNSDYYALSFAQQRLWFLDQFESDSASYNISAALRLDGHLDVEALRCVFASIVERHEALRTSFVTLDGKAQQIIHSPEDWQLPITELSDLSEKAQQQELDNAIALEAQLPFDLAQCPLMRTQLLKLNDTQHVLLVTMHHIVSDGWSLGVLVKEVGHLYQSLVLQQPDALPELPIQYLDFAHWQRSWLQGDILEKQLAYWRHQLADVPVLEIPTDFIRPPKLGTRGAHLPAHYDSSIAAGLHDLSRRKGVTLYTTLLAAFGVLMHRYSRQDDFCVGTPIANRTRAELEPLIGCFVNSLAMRLDMSDDPSFETLLQQVKNTTLQAYSHQELPFERLVDELNVSRVMSHSPLFQTLFSLTNTHPGQSLELPGITIETLPAETASSKFDLSLNLKEDQGQLKGEWEYNTDLFSEATIARIANHFRSLLKAILQNPAEKISTLNLMQENERQQILVEWNQTQTQTQLKTDYDRDASIVHYFELQVESRLDNIAVVHQSQSGERQALTYGELNQRANKVAQILLARGVLPGDRVGLCVERSLHMMTSLLGILKVGAAYVPLDWNYPEARLQTLIDSANLKLVVVDSSLVHHLPVKPMDIVTSSQIKEWVNKAETDSAIDSKRMWSDIDGAQSAYVMFTSGSTGKPKGIEVSHRNVTRLVKNNNFMTMDETTVFMQYAPIVFDASTLEIWAPLLNGGTLVVAPAGEMTVDALNDLIKTESINSLWLTAALFHVIAEYKIECFHPLKTLLVGGDVLSPKWVRKVLDEVQGLCLVNGYGPTENTTFTSCYPMTQSQQVQGRVPIGRPIANTTIYILDQNLQPVPVGMVGELCSSGDGLSKGYLDSNLNEGVFIPNPFALAGDESSERLYKTGDLARYRADGVIEYLGRKDQQVKVRGYRIELAEIEEAIVQIEGVREVAVVVREDEPGIKRLAAYFVADDLEGKTLRSNLKKRLPHYMIPSVIMLMDSLPLTRNGKIDRVALLKLPIEIDSETKSALPSTERERVLTNIWKDVLHIKNVGLHDNFFEMGGDSILSIQIISRAKKAGIRLTVKQLFENQTIAELAGAASEVDHPVLAEQGRLEGEALISPIQQWFFSQQQEQPHYYNQAVLLKLGRELSNKTIEYALSRIVDQHDGLRMQFEHRNSSWHQRYGAKPEALFSTVILTEESALADVLRQNQASLCLETGPLLKAVSIQMPNGERLLHWVIHHLVVDGVSWRILLEDFNQACHSSQTPATMLGEKTTSFRQWTATNKAHFDSGGFDVDLSYWLELSDTLSLNDSTFALPANFSRGHITEIKGTEIKGTAINHISIKNCVAQEKKVVVALDPQLTQSLLREVNSAYNTDINDILLTALMQTLSRWTGFSQALINLEGHGRETDTRDLDSKGIDLSRTVGWFTSLYPVGISLPVSDKGEQASLEAQIKSIKEQLRRVPNHGFGFGMHRLWNQDAAVQNKLAVLSKVEVAFNYLGQFDSIKENSSLFSLTTADRGGDQASTTKRMHGLDINGHILEGQLQLEWTFSNERFNVQSIETVASRYITLLTEIIEHCIDTRYFGYTPSDFPLAELTQETIDQQFGQTAAIENVYPLSPMQQGMLFHGLYEEALDDVDAGVYVEQLTVALHGEVDHLRFEQAWNSIIRRHAVLRSAFIWEGLSRPLQVVYSDLAVKIEVVDLCHLSEAEKAIQLARFLEGDTKKGFEFSKPGLNRLTLIKFSHNQTRLVWSFHHIILDGWSLPIVMRELFVSYSELVKGNIPRLPSPPKYHQFIAWLSRNDASEAAQFWQSYLAGFNAPTLITVKKNAERVGKTEQQSKMSVYQEQELSVYQERELSLSTTTTASLQALAKNQHLTFNTLLQGAWGLLLSRYSGEQDVVFGTTVSGRPAELNDVENIVGLFINTLPLRLRIEKNQPLITLLQTMQNMQIESRRFESTPLVDIHHVSEVPGDQPLFESILVFENYPVEQVLQDKTLLLAVEDVQSVEHTNYPLTVIVEPGAELKLKLSYDTSLFDSSTIAGMLGHLEVLLQSMSQGLAVGVDELEWLTSSEKKQILINWNNTQTEYPAHRCIHELFEDQVAQNPDRQAVVFDEVVLSYGELNARANQLAHYLVTFGIGEDSVVAIMLERSWQTIVAELAMLKVGGGYLALDPSYPDDRITYMLKDAKASLLITRSDMKSRIESYQPEQQQMVLIDADVDEKAIQLMPTFGLASNIASSVQKKSSERLAYIVYTSGSTGKPKGICVPHRGVVRLVRNTNYIDIDFEDRIGHCSNTSFDASTFEVWGALCNGACVVGFSKDEMLSPDDFIAKVDRTQVNTLFFTTALLNAFSLHHVALFGRLKTMLFGGEAVDPQRVRRILKESPPENLIHVYGPTENTVYSTWFKVEEVPEGAVTIPIGYPISNSTAYILDTAGHPVPPGVAGEIVCGGDGLALGYLNQLEKTTAQFIPDPFATRKRANKTQSGETGRLYLTGDLGRYRDDGAIEILGRIDDQVKLRGFRIELAEIAVALREFDGVHDAVVLVREDEPGQKRLVAYLSVGALSESLSEEQSPNKTLNIEMINAGLKKSLPSYMVPSAMVLLDVLPLTANGKLDVPALPLPNKEIAAETFVVARNDKEQSLTDIWTQVLNNDAISVTDNFFELGGDSILSIQIMSRAKTAGLQLTAKQIFEYQTIAELAAVATELSAANCADQGSVIGKAKLSPVQRFYLDQYNDSQDEVKHYNQSVLLSTAETISSTTIQIAVYAILSQHDSLRATFKRPSVQRDSKSDDAGETQQREMCFDEWTDEQRDAVFSIRDLSTVAEAGFEEALTSACNTAQSSLVLATGPLVRFVFINTPSGERNRLLAVAHHLVVDVFSWRILLEDLQTALEQLLTPSHGDTPDLVDSDHVDLRYVGSDHVNLIHVDLGDKTSSWLQWMMALEDYSHGSDVINDEAYWLTEQSDNTLLPVDRDGENTVAQVESIDIRLNEEDTTQLLTQAGGAYRTEINDLLLTALGMTLGPWADADTVLVDLEGHGREEISDTVDVSRTVGWFTSIFPVSLSVDPLTLDSLTLDPSTEKQSGLAKQIKQTKEYLHIVPKKGLSYGLLKYRSTDDQTRLKLRQQPQAQISFNYLGQLDSVLENNSNTIATEPLIQLAMESSGAEISPQGPRHYLLEVSGRVLDGCLQMNWRYCNAIHDAGTIDTLANQFVDNLKTIIDHCCEVSDGSNSSDGQLKHGGYTPSDFPLAQLDQVTLDAVVGEIRDVENIYPLSPVQEGMLFHSLMEPDSWVYFDQVSVDLGSHLDAKSFVKAWEIIYQRHPILRSSCLWQEVARPLQMVRQSISLPFVALDWSSSGEGLAEAKVDQRLQQFLEDDRNTGFDFSISSISRLVLIKLPSGRYQFIWSFHHILLDGWSMPLVFGELFAVYEKLCDVKIEDQRNPDQKTHQPPDVFPGLAIAPKYEKYIEWLESNDGDEAELFWKDYLLGFTAPTPLIINNSIAEVAQYQKDSSGGQAAYQERQCILDPALLRSLEKMAKQNHLTLNQILQGFWGILLSRYSGESDVCFGTTVSGRPAEVPGIESMVGLFINTLPMRLQVVEEQSFVSWCQATQQTQLPLKNYESSSLVDIQRWSDVPSKSPLFNSILVFENYPVDSALKAYQESLGVGDIASFQQTNFPLTLIALPGEDFVLRFSFDSFVFQPAAIERALGHLVQMMTAIADNPQLPIERLPLLSPEETQQCVFDWNENKWEFDQSALIQDVFAEQVSRAPNSVATVFGGSQLTSTELTRTQLTSSQLTYLQLNQKANQLSHYLVASGVKQGDLIALCLDRCEEMIVAMLAVLKVGAAYVPIDPGYPRDRIEFMLQDIARATPSSASGPVAISNERCLKESDLSEVSDTHQLLCLDRKADLIAAQSNVDLIVQRVPGGESLANVIYTSGSTGTPKGVCIPHRGVIRLALHSDYVDFSPKQRVALAANVSFDAATMEIWGALLNGCTLIGISKEELLSTRLFYETIIHHEISVLFLTTALFNLYAQEMPAVFEDLDYLLFGGEACDPQSIRKVIECDFSCHLIHLYGPAENSTISTWHEVNAVAEGVSTVPIGKPNTNSTVYVLDKRHRPVPIDVPGEIYTGGPGLALGYLNDEDLTRQRFIPHPFLKGELLYRTGDWGRYLPDGSIEMLGRIDDQVKIRGFRIELAEIEQAISNVPGVQNSVVLVDSGNQHLVAYVLTDIKADVPLDVRGDSSTVTIAEIKATLKNKLPRYMIPNYFILLEEFPLTANGKVDRRALPPWDGGEESAHEIVAPRNQVETTLVAIWRELLSLPQVGIEDDFFELGGHSLLVTKAHSRILQQLHVDLPLRTLFEVATIAGIAEIIIAVGGESFKEETEEDDDEFEEGSI
ncbi:MAG: amino acid adenylation domain-containing protein [Pseudomonadales bacterium]|nr:amino acid adenylation domain-containing protein [Pseudomonadales bacterium]